MSGTTLILGAGASVPYRFPIGSTLLANVIAGFEEVHREFYNAPGDGHRDRLREKIYSSGYQSIDKYLSENQDFSNEIRASIFKILLEREIIDPTKFDNYNKEPGYFDWYKHYFNELIRDKSSLYKLPTQHVITFNYDRSFEFYLQRFIKAKLMKLDGPFNKVEDAKAFELMHEKFKIHHIHGRLPNLPNEKFHQNDSVELPYGTSQFQDAYRRHFNDDRAFAKKYITTLYENAEPSEDFAEIIGNSNRVLFLGFAFLPENMKKIGIEGKLSESFPNTKFSGTGFKLGKVRHSELVSQGIKVCSNEYIDCNMYFNEVEPVVLPP